MLLEIHIHIHTPMFHLHILILIIVYTDDNVELTFREEMQPKSPGGCLVVSNTCTCLSEIQYCSRISCFEYSGVPRFDLRRLLASSSDS